MSDNIYAYAWNMGLICIRNFWIDVQVRFNRPQDRSSYCLVAGSQAPINKWALFHWDEQFITPCSLHQINSGTRTGGWIPGIQFMHGPLPE